jgi:hypothetical protein
MKSRTLIRTSVAVLVASIAWAATLQVQAQHINFNNRVPGSGVDAPIFHTDCLTPLAGLDFQAGLWAGPAGALVFDLVQVGEPAFFRTGSGAGYLASGPLIEIPFLDFEETGTFQVRAWETAAGTFEAAQAGAGPYGQSGLFRVVLYGDPQGPWGNAMVGLESFCLVPEPSALWLWASGGMALGWLLVLRSRHIRNHEGPDVQGLDDQMD